jgi:chorismate synthase
MNIFGRFFRVSLWGESHGPAVGALIDGCPAGIALQPEDFCHDLERRKSGQPGTTARRETDRPVLDSGVFKNRTTGSPIMIRFANADTASGDYDLINKYPRPGHADLQAYHKFQGFNDHRGGGHFSGRLTVGLVAAGVIAKKIIPRVKFKATLISAGGSKNIGSSVSLAVVAGDSVGGLVECRITKLSPGLGEPFFDSTESLLSHILFSIPGVKAIEFGDGFAAASMSGSRYNDPIVSLTGRTSTNRCGGINGGLTNGNELGLRLAIRPTATIGQEQLTIDKATGKKAAICFGGRHDACIALRVPVVVEAACAIVMADLYLAHRTVNGTSLKQIKL